VYAARSAAASPATAATGHHQLLRRAWAAGLGPTDLAADLTIDIDSTVCETYGLAKQGGGFAYTASAATTR
jgi:hypothetical protein